MEGRPVCCRESVGPKKGVEAADSDKLVRQPDGSVLELGDGV